MKKNLLAEKIQEMKNKKIEEAIDNLQTKEEKDLKKLLVILINMKLSRLKI